MFVECTHKMRTHGGVGGRSRCDPMRRLGRRMGEMLFSVVFNRPSKCGDVTVGDAEKSRPAPRGPKSRGNGRSSGRNVDSTGVHSYRRIMLRVGDPSFSALSLIKMNIIVKFITMSIIDAILSIIVKCKKHLSTAVGGSFTRQLFNLCE